MNLVTRTFGKKTRVSGLQKSAAAYFLAQSLPKFSEPVLLLCSDEDEAQTFLEDLRFLSSFLKQEPLSFLWLPAWESSAYRKLAPNISYRMERLRALYASTQATHVAKIIVSTPQALLQSTINRQFLSKSFALMPGTEIELHALAMQLLQFGYTKTETVEDVGSFSIRGGIVDIYSPGHEYPCRLEFFDTTVESLRFYNPETQRSFAEEDKEKKLVVLPARELDCSQENLSATRERIRSWSDSQDLPRSSRERINDLLGQGIVTAEMDYLLPLFQDNPSYGYEYFSNFIWIWHDEKTLKSTLAKFLANEEKNYSKALADLQLIAPHTQIYKDPQALFSFCQDRQEIFLDALRMENAGIEPHYDIPSEQGRSLHIKENAKSGKKSSLNVDSLLKEIEKRKIQGNHLVLTANSQAQMDRLAFLLEQRGIKSQIIHNCGELIPGQLDKISLLHGSLSQGFTLPEAKLSFISEDEIFGKKIHTRSTRKNGSAPMKYLDELQLDELVVHVEHGIGRYKGLVHLNSGGLSGDFVHLEYAENDKLYLPVYRLELLQKYVGSSSGKASLDRLGTQQFLKAKERAKAAVKDIAGKLLRIHAQRTSQKGYAFSAPDELFREFEAEFPYDETADQLKAIQDTVEDMCEERPMDRLVCGDVGFGKTEVAIRAAFKAAQDGKQVAVLAPTTILAEQHYQTFSNRLREHPMRVAGISRFKSREEQKKTLAELSAGKIDIIIGTHRLLSKDVHFHDLGLLIIDEEQRFGVEHKEKLKEIRATADVLTLTATPIPRTLHLSLMGLRDISLIQTAPANRLAIKTYLASFDLELIKTAVETELARGGQVYFIHNRVQTIVQMQKKLKEHMPKVKIGIAHGQMSATELEKVMLGFYQKEYDILLATTIIENGLDVPNANTLIVNRADTFGLSQLYQIRGRVGRSQNRAYAYLLVPEEGTITDEARERLMILQRLVDLGSGYAIASHDLELRGGGDILGGAQSGHIAEIGYDMYLELLGEEIHRLKGETTPMEKEEDVEINAPFPALIPESFIPDMRARLSTYRHLAALKTEEDLSDAKNALIDRYGKIPPPTYELFSLLNLKLLLRRMGFKAITIGKHAFTISAGQAPKISPDKLLLLVAKEKQKYSLTPEAKLTMRGNFSSLKSVFDEVRNLIALIHSS